MYIPRDPNFLPERMQYALRHCCEECVFFQESPDPSDAKDDTRHDATDRRVCAHGWPNDEHRQAHYDAEPDLLVFCKEFEIP